MDSVHKALKIIHTHTHTHTHLKINVTFILYLVTF